MAHKKIETSMPVPIKMSPMVRLDATDLPAIKDWKVGGKYKLVLDVEQTSASKDEFYGNRPMTASFKILKATSINNESYHSPKRTMMSQSMKKRTEENY